MVNIGFQNNMKHKKQEISYETDRDGGFRVPAAEL